MTIEIDPWEAYAPGIFRIPGLDGSALLLRGVLDRRDMPEGDGACLAFDVGLLDVRRQVTYFMRAGRSDVVDTLAHFLLTAANDYHPEDSLPPFTDQVMGLTLTVAASTDATLTLRVDVVRDQEADPQESDGIEFETSRAAFVTASMAVRVLDGSTDDEYPGEVL